MWDHKVSVEEELQQRDTRSAHHAVASGISGMRRRSFRKCLRQQVRSILVEALLNGLRVQDIGVQPGIDFFPLARCNEVKNSATRLRTMTQMDHPLVVPDHIQGTCRHLSEGGREVRTAKRTETILSFRLCVRVPRILWGAYRAKHKQCREVRLVKDINVSVGREISSVAQETLLPVDLVLQFRVNTVLYLLPGVEIGHVIDAGQVCRH